jgi:hypothetical protein
MKNQLIAKQQIVLELLEEALYNELENILTTIPDLKANILKNIRWAFFNKKTFVNTNVEEFSRKNGRIQMTAPTCLIPIPEGIAQLRLDQIFQAENEINKALSHDLLFPFQPMFTQEVYNHKTSGFIGISLDWEDCQVTTLEIPVQEAANVQDFFEFYEAQITLPPPDVVFEMNGYGNVPDWQWDDITAYEKWTWKVRDILQTTTQDQYMQLGGWGHFIQSDYYNYIGQINNNIGDAGAVFLSLNTELQVVGDVDMH